MMGNAAHHAASSLNPASLFEVEARVARVHLARVAVAQVADEVGAHGGAGPERRVDLVGVEAAHRPAVDPESPRREDEVAALQAAVAEGGRLDDRGLAGKP